ncbi:MAG: hypothetical protein HKN18_01265 [Silicimonas sp.]|nr:hypothetical protein [Silicimonas sp.]
MASDPFKLRQPFFLPRSRRIAVTGVCLGWAVLELVTGNPFWSAMIGALGGYLAIEFFLWFDPANYDETDNDRTN